MMMPLMFYQQIFGKQGKNGHAYIYQGEGCCGCVVTEEEKIHTRTWITHHMLYSSLEPPNMDGAMQSSLSARQATLPRGSFWRAKLTTSDDIRIFLAHVTTFYDLRTTLMTSGDNILTTLKTNGEDTLTTLTTGGEDTLTTHLTTSDYLVTTWHDVTDDPCDSIEDLYGIHCPND
jgi:hypothetical protein